MFVIHLEHAPDSIRGEMSLFSQEIAPYTFVSNASAKTRDRLWTDIMKVNGISAVMIYSSKNEIGYEVKKYGIPTYEFQDFNGLCLMVKPANTLTKSIAHNLWAKLNPYKSLLDHMIETGFTAKCLMDGLFRPLVNKVSNLVSIDPETIKKQITFICAIHDIGKAHPIFQSRNSETNELLESNGLTMESISHKFRHEEYAEEIIPCLFRQDAELFSQIAVRQIISMHHQKECQRNPETNYIKIRSNIKERWSDIQKYIYDYVKEIFPFSKIDFLEDIEDEKDCFTIENGILGILITSDWIASNEMVYPSGFIDEYFDINEYFAIKKNQLDIFLDANLKSSVFPKEKSFKEIFEFNSIHPVQSDIEKIVNENNVKIMLIESGCGSGKTEAALYAASVMGYKNNLSGVYMGLPTGASAEAIQGRIDSFMDSLKMDKTKLYTSKSMLLKDPNEQTAWTDISRQRMLAASAVGTVDQVMSAARTVRFESVRMAGLSSKVLIIDEIHAYDALMIMTIKRLLQLCNAIGVPVILLSATLSKSMKKDLFSSIVEKKQMNIHEGYPLISYITDDNTFHEVQSVSYEADRNISCKFISILNEPDKIAELAVKNIESNGCECVILNTVNDAIKVYDSVKKIVSSDCKVILYHGRMTAASKDRKMKMILNWCGKDRKHRPQKAIIIGTQVLEQSLDIDVDYMVTALCPIDLLIQRIGRYRRHGDTGTIRENNEIPFEVNILTSNNENYGSTEKVYEKSFLTSTEKLICKNPVLTIPSENPFLINQVYETPDSEILRKTRIQRSKSNMGNIDVSQGFEGLYMACQQGYLSDRYIDVRSSDFPTEQIAILNEKELSLITNPSENDHMELIKLFKEKVVTVNSRSIEKFEDYEKDMESKGFFKNIKIYTNDNCISSDGIKKFSIDEEYGFRILDN